MFFPYVFDDVKELEMANSNNSLKDDLDDGLDIDDELLDSSFLEDDEADLSSALKGASHADIRRKIEERLEMRRLRDELGMSDDYLDI